MSELPRILLCACAELPGPSAVGVRLDQFSRALEGAAEVDALCLKGAGAAHIERIRGTRLLRVPTPSEGRGQVTDAYRRALKRQIAADEYDLIIAGDLASAGALLEEGVRGATRLVIDVAEADATASPMAASSSPGTLEASPRFRGILGALSEADFVFAQSRALARLLVGHIDPRRVELLERAVDLEVFGAAALRPRKKPKVTLFGGQEQQERWPALLDFAACLVRTVPDARVELLGAPTAGSQAFQDQVGRLGLSTRVKCQLTHSPLETAGRLARADVVITPVFASSLFSPACLPHRALEALATARPLVVARRDLPAAQLARGAPVGVMEVPLDADSIARATLALLSDPVRADDVASAGREFVGDSASLETRLATIRSVLSSRLGRPLSPRGTSELIPHESWTHGTHAPLQLPPPPITGRGAASESDLSHVIVKAIAPTASLLSEEPVTTTRQGVVDDQVVEHSLRIRTAQDGDAGSSEPIPATQGPRDDAAGRADKTPRVAPLPRTLRVEIAAVTTDLPDEWSGETTADPAPSHGTGLSPHRLSSVDPALEFGEVESSSGGQEGVHASDPWRHDTIADASPIFVSDEHGASRTERAQHADRHEKGGSSKPDNGPSDA
ncbi:MAG: glycosyltransferase family 4 protein [Myxococcota bacterium]